MAAQAKRPVTLDEVRRVVLELAQEQVLTPSLRVLRERLGRGSLSTIHAHLQLIREEQTRPPEANADLAAFRSLSPDLSARVTAAIRVERAVEVEHLHAELAQARLDRDQALAANADLSVAVEQRQAELEAVRSDLAVARSQLLQAELEHRAQLDRVTSTQRQLDALAGSLADLRTQTAQHHQALATATEAALAEHSEVVRHGSEAAAVLADQIEASQAIIATRDLVDQRERRTLQRQLAVVVYHLSRPPAVLPHPPRGGRDMPGRFP